MADDLQLRVEVGTQRRARFVQDLPMDRRCFAASFENESSISSFASAKNHPSFDGYAADATGTFTILFRDGSKFDFGKDEFKLTIVDSANKKAVYDKPVSLS